MPIAASDESVDHSEKDKTTFRHRIREGLCAAAAKFANAWDNDPGEVIINLILFLAIDGLIIFGLVVWLLHAWIWCVATILSVSLFVYGIYRFINLGHRVNEGGIEYDH